jgi:hypothetical protein
MRAVSFLPSLPASAEVLMPMVRPRPRVVEVGQGLADGDVLDAGDGDDVAGARFVHGHAVEFLGHEQLGDLGLLHRSVGAAPRHLLALADGALVHATHGQASQVGVGGEVGHQRLQGGTLGVLGGGDGVSQHIEERGEVGLLGVCRQRGRAGLPVGVDDREVDLLLVGAQVEEQLVDLVHHLRHARVGAVDLVHHEHHGQAALEGLAQHEARLWQGPFGGVDQQQHAIHHVEAALDLAAEVGVTRRVDDVDGQVAALHRRVLGEDRDALLALEVAGVHDARLNVLVLAEGAALPEHGVDEGGLAVVHMGHDRHVSEVIPGRHGGGH